MALTGGRPESYGQPRGWGKFAIRLRLGHTTHAGDGGRRETQPRPAANTAPTKKLGDHTEKTSESRTETPRWGRKRETLSGATSMT